VTNPTRSDVLVLVRAHVFAIPFAAKAAAATAFETKVAVWLGTGRAQFGDLSWHADGTRAKRQPTVQNLQRSFQSL
jgi:hypothetical protein